jgi:hypothetical protein
MSANVNKGCKSIIKDLDLALEQAYIERVKAIKLKESKKK